MKILFATVPPVIEGPGGPTSQLASMRYRVIIPAQQLARLGHQVRIASLPVEGWSQAILDAPCDVLVVSKSLDPRTEAMARAKKAQGSRVIADLCDDHFAYADRGAIVRTLISLADEIVASTGAMAESIRENTGRASIVITDPVEGARGAPRFAPKLQGLRLAWFGNRTNLDAVALKSQELVDLARQVPVHLLVVTDPAPEVTELVTQLNAACAGRARVECIPWSIEATWQLLEQCDLVWIPASGAIPKMVKSPNRLLESLWAGRAVVADPIPSYLPFGDLIPLGSTLAQGAIAALRDPAGVEARIGQAQRRIASLHSPFECGRQWAAAIGDTSARPLRLNLGCGDKILAGYVNVDVVQARAGVRPDVICDLHDLSSFADNCADEILSVHVVEHFWRWEVLDVLREWVRVLKPGGRMNIECPNLTSACETFLQDPARHAQADQSGQRTMWVFYGDPSWKDPLMVHRWGYTPASLKQLLSEAGLVDVAVEPAQFKLREPRDMRVAGTKPLHG